MSEEIFPLGAVLRFETTVEALSAPFTEGYTLFSPENVELKIDTASGQNIVPLTSMVGFGTGQFYLDVPSSSSWGASGVFKATIISGTAVIGITRFRMSL